ncbi:MAG: zf-HC2 domain-containing protein [Pseudomonadales bacterium]
MTCPSPLIRSMYVDGALPADEADALTRHAASCADCHGRIDALRREQRAIRQALRAAEVPVPAPVSGFVPPPTIPALLVWLGWGALATWAVNLAWVTAAPLAPPLWLEWLAPDLSGSAVAALVGALVRVAGAADQLWLDAISAGGLAALLLLSLALVWLLTRRPPTHQIHNVPWPVLPAVLPALLLPLLALAPTPGQAFELRRDDVRITIAADEIIDDTAVLIAETVLVEGTVTGDLVVLGERVTVRGRVGGVLVAMAEDLSVEGEVGGTVLGLGETVNLRGATLEANGYALGETVSVARDVRVAGNAAIGARDLDMQGSVTRDLLTLAETVDVGGSTGGDLRAYAGRVSLDDGARVGGDLIARVRGADDLQISSAASIEGETRRDTWPERRSRYLTADYYLGEALSLAAAFVFGLVLFWLFPGLREDRLHSGTEVLTTAGFGALALIVVPIAALIVMITLIGAPLGLLALALWITALYAAGIVAAALLGQRLLDPTRQRPALLLLAGLAVFTVLTAIPYLGGLVRLAALLIGLGSIVAWLRDRWASPAAA